MYHKHVILTTEGCARQSKERRSVRQINLDSSSTFTPKHLQQLGQVSFTFCNINKMGNLNPDLKDRPAQRYKPWYRPESLRHVKGEKRQKQRIKP